MESSVVDALIQGGAVGISLALLIFCWKVISLHNKTISGHLENSNSASIALAKALTQLSERINSCPVNDPNKRYSIKK